MKRQIAMAAGDGIGPEIMAAVLRLFNAAHVPLTFVPVDMGLTFFQQGHSSGMTPDAKATVEELGILFKGPMETPKGKGVKSINVTARKVWNTYANKRVFRSMNGVDTPFSRANIPIDIILVRENIEDTYGGIEHFLTNDVALCRRIITRQGSEQVHRYAFEMAAKTGRKRITCGHKANIMKITDGLFLEVFHEIAKEYPSLKADDIIVDDLAMKLVRSPSLFDVLVLPNLQGDIISDLCAGLVGGLGFAPSANIGDSISIFEAVHGTAPDIAGKGIANPTSLLMSGLMMLQHVGLSGKAHQIEQALSQALQDGIHTVDFGTNASAPLSTEDFIDALIERLPADSPFDRGSPANQDIARISGARSEFKFLKSSGEEATIEGMDLFIESALQPELLAGLVEKLLPTSLRLSVISNRGTQVWPTGSFYTDCIEQFGLRIEKVSGSVSRLELLDLARLLGSQIAICSFEFLISYKGKAAYSLAQGQ